MAAEHRLVEFGPETQLRMAEPSYERTAGLWRVETDQGPKWFWAYDFPASNSLSESLKHGSAKVQELSQSDALRRASEKLALACRLPAASPRARTVIENAIATARFKKLQGDDPAVTPLQAYDGDAARTADAVMEALSKDGLRVI